MKSKDKKPEVEFIGGNGPLTQEEQLAISAFIRLRKKVARKRKKPSEKMANKD